MREARDGLKIQEALKEHLCRPFRVHPVSYIPFKLHLPWYCYLIFCKQHHCGNSSLRYELIQYLHSRQVEINYILTLSGIECRCIDRAMLIDILIRGKSKLGLYAEHCAHSLTCGNDSKDISKVTYLD